MPRICWSGAEHSAMLVAGLLLLSIGVFGSFLSKFHSQMLGTSILTYFNPAKQFQSTCETRDWAPVSFSAPRLRSTLHLCCSESAPVERYGEASPRAILSLLSHWPLNASPVFSIERLNWPLLSYGLSERWWKVIRNLGQIAHRKKPLLQVFRFRLWQLVVRRPLIGAWAHALLANCPGYGLLAHSDHLGNRHPCILANSLRFFFWCTDHIII